MSENLFEREAAANYIPSFCIALIWNAPRKGMRYSRDPYRNVVLEAAARSPGVISNSKLVTRGLRAIARHPTLIHGSEQVKIVKGSEDGKPRSIIFLNPHEMLFRHDPIYDIPQVGPWVVQSLFEFAMAATATVDFRNN